MDDFQQLYINTNDVIVRKWNNKIKHHSLYKIYDEEYNKNDYLGEFKIVFPKKWVWQTLDKNNKNSQVFSKNASKYTEEIEFKNDVYTIKHMNLLPYMTLEEFKFIIASILKIEYLDILSVSTDMTLDAVNDIDKERTKNFKWFHTMDKNLLDYDAYNTTMSIGYKKLYVDVFWKNIKLNVNYDYKFYDNYCKICEYIQKLMDNYDNLLEKGFSKIDKELLLNTRRIQNIEVSLIYGKNMNLTNLNKNDTLLNEINIIKLFNLIRVSTNLKKVLIHDNSLTEYNNNSRETQYIKTPLGSEDVFKNTFSRFNCCSIYVIDEIVAGLVLSRIEFYKNGLIKCCFTVNDPDATLDLIKESLSLYFKYEFNEETKKKEFKGKFWKLLKKLKLEECVFDFYFNIENYVPIYSNLSCVYGLEHVKADKFKKVFNLVEQKIPALVYNTNTSLFLNLYSSYNLSTFYGYHYSKSLHNVVTDTTLRADVLTHGHLQAPDDKTIIFYLSKCFNEDDIIMNSLLCIPIFGIIVEKKISNENYSKTSPLKRENEIRKKYKSVPTKRAIKKLSEIDPVLFATRNINKTESRPYSSLAQKREQRVVAITKDEYNELYKINPGYVIDIRNQSQGNQRLYLFCPFEKFKFLNFHQYHNQLCVPKCTTAITKQTQYLYCNDQLDAKNVKDTFFGETSKMIVYYSPLLLSGRKCYPPEELSIICENYLLLKLEQNVDLLNFCKTNYSLDPFIITRDNVNKQYILNTELDQNTDYILILQSELDHGYYLIIDDNQKPFILSEHNEVLQFFKSIQINKNVGYELFNFIDDIFKLNISSEYQTKTFRKILDILIEKYAIKIVTNTEKTEIIAIVKTDQNILLFTPTLAFDKTAFDLQEININIAISNYKFPDISKFDKRFIKNYYKDYKDKLIHVIEYNGVNVIIKPVKESDIYQRGVNQYGAPVVIFDYKSYYNYFLFGASKKIKENDFIKIQQNNTIKNLIYIYIFIYYNTIINADKNNIKKDLKEILKDVNILTDKEETKINNLDEKYNIAWKDSKINIKDFDSIYNNIIDNLSYTTLINIIYNELSNNMNIYSENNTSSKISAKIITNNTI